MGQGASSVNFPYSTLTRRAHFLAHPCLVHVAQAVTQPPIHLPFCRFQDQSYQRRPGSWCTGKCTIQCWFHCSPRPCPALHILLGMHRRHAYRHHRKRGQRDCSALTARPQIASCTSVQEGRAPARAHYSRDAVERDTRFPCFPHYTRTVSLLSRIHLLVRCGYACHPCPHC